MSMHEHCYVGPYFEITEKNRKFLSELRDKEDDFAVRFYEDLFYRPLEYKEIWIPQYPGKWAFEYNPDSGKYEHVVVRLDAQVISDAVYAFTEKYNDIFLTLEKLSLIHI